MSESCWVTVRAISPPASDNWSVRRGSGMAVGDVNGDDIADVVTADNANVNVRLGNGTGGLQPPPWGQSYPAGDGIRSIALGDFDHDEVLDVVFANYVSNRSASSAVAATARSHRPNISPLARALFQSPPAISTATAG